GHREAVESALRDGCGLLLTGRAMSAVALLGIDAVSPGVDEEGSERTGVLWKPLYEDHPAVAASDSLRVPLAAGETGPVVRYEGLLPETGEALAGTLRSGHDVPRELSVVSWTVGAGSVLGVGLPVSLAEPQPAEIAHDRDRFLSGCLGSLVDSDRPSRPMSTADFATFRSRLADDPTRPRYHLTPPANWLNDPNGLIEWNGTYHVFYQYNPGGPFHDSIHWGHATSADLVHWTDRPVALAPTPGGPDEHGCWSGCAVDDDGTPTLVYTGGSGRRQVPCLATTSDPDLQQWEKYDDNPVINGPPAELDILASDHWEAEFRDHNVWHDGQRWQHLIGTGLADDRGAVVRYSSEDLREWDYEGPLLVGEPEAPNVVWECPELLDLGAKQLLHVSNYETVRYFVGELRDGEFVVDHEGCLDPGDFYAPQSLDDGDRYLTWGWIKEARDESAQWDAGWSGALSLPRVISLGADGHIRQRPAEELTALRTDQLHHTKSTTLRPDTEPRRFDGSRHLEFDCTVRLDDAAAVELGVLESPDGEERTVIRYTREGELIVDRSNASLDERTETESQQITVTPYDEPLSLRGFVDGSVLELFANERHCLTSRVYPTRPDSTGLSMAAEGGRATVEELSVWELGSAMDVESDGHENEV
ncbi:MAG: glycoside hydrolase family 32 protein, partial [Natrialbaceae archaeon]